MVFGVICPREILMPGKITRFLILFLRDKVAVGFILGGAISKMVSSLVNDIINPIVGLILGTVGNLNDLYVPIGGAKLVWGSFVNTAIDFFIIAFVVYFGVKLLRLDRLDKKK
jgi:large conductance mechanosensitive channel